MTEKIFIDQEITDILWLNTSHDKFIINLYQISPYLSQDLLACANLCQQGIHKGQRTLRCCLFEWSESERMCKLHHECKTKSPLKEGLLTCRKKGDVLSKLTDI